MSAEGVKLSGIPFRDETADGWNSGESPEGVPKVQARERKSLRQKDRAAYISADFGLVCTLVSDENSEQFLYRELLLLLQFAN